MHETRAFTLDGERIELTAVVFAGITHILVPVSLWGENAAKKAERAARVWAKELPPVFGLLLFDEKEKSLKPLVAVEDVSLIWERGCGSGTSAVGAYLAVREKKDITVSLKQPGGVMHATVSYQNGAVTKIEITGSVAIVAEGWHIYKKSADEKSAFFCYVRGKPCKISIFLHFWQIA